MNRDQVVETVRAAREFIKRAELWNTREKADAKSQGIIDYLLTKYPHGTASMPDGVVKEFIDAHSDNQIPTKYSASLKRASLDLTRALAEMRSR